ncbi:MAG TPA: nucleotidyltransferase domain-containing protein [Pyrinomonadaceae bacterium]|nr:nucleotidyltransferase domain-containing protein [Pyrinomonadaceae bacterium]
MTTQRPEPAEAARRILGERYAGAGVLFLAGSVVRGEATPGSDLDLVVVYERLPNAYRESFVYEGWPVEAFVHDPETLRRFFQSDSREGIPSILCMVLEGVELPAPSQLSAGLKAEAAAIVEAGPPVWDEEHVGNVRYWLTDCVDDLRHPRSDEELVATGAQLYELAADFFLRSRGLWSARRKMIPRRLRETDPDFAGRFNCAFDALFIEKRQDEVIALVADMLAPHGGFLFEGYRRDAPPPP